MKTDGCGRAWLVAGTRLGKVCFGKETGQGTLKRKGKPRREEEPGQRLGLYKGTETEKISLVSDPRSN